MVAESITWVNVTGAVRAYLREALPEVEERIYFGFQPEATLPQIAMFRIRGPDADCLFQFDCWAADEFSADTISAALCSAVDSLSRFRHDGVLLHGGRVETKRWLPDEESQSLARYIVDCTFTATASE